MGVQLIFVVEANKSCKSDWIYIKSTIDYFYEYNRTGLKLSPVYMDGKGNYKQKEKEVKSLISQYSKASKGNKSKVIYCFDCDEYDNKIEDLTFLKTVKKYCDDRGYSGGDVSCLSALFQHANGDDCSYRAYALEKCGRPTWYKRHRC